MVSAVTTTNIDLPMTCDMRRALAGLICTTVWRGKSEDKQALADRLTVQPFEAMTTAEIVQLADATCDEAAVMRLLHMCDETPYEIGDTYLCPNCHDEGVVVDDHNRWHRCYLCNPYLPKETRTP